MIKLTATMTPAAWRHTLALYQTAFPAVERLNPKWLRYRTRTSQAEWLQVEVDEQWAGFAYVLVGPHLVYVLYLAVSPTLRGQGVGTAVLQAIQQRYPDHVITLSAERPQQKGVTNYAQRLRRQKFYVQNGFKLAGFYSRERAGVEYDFYFTAPTQPARQWLQQQFVTVMRRWAKRRYKYYFAMKLIEE